jgi:hypothetical protein
MSASAPRRTTTSLAVLDHKAQFALSYPGGAEAIAAGRRDWRAFYALRMLRSAAQVLKRRGPTADAARLLREALSVGPASIALGAAIWLRPQSSRMVRRRSGRAGLAAAAAAHPAAPEPR